MNELEYLKKYGDYTKKNIERVKNGEPVQYVIGNVDFFGNIINVDNRVLIPRRETEELVDYTVKYLKNMFNRKIDIVDIGTGSGCIAITIKKMIDSNVHAVDISTDALDLAKENARINNVDITFLEGDMLSPLCQKYDCIISNPPYISYQEDIMDIVKNNEPEIALYAPDKGLKFYKEIIKNSSCYLNEKNIIAFEIGWSQAEAIINYAKIYYPNSNIIKKKDMQGFDRFIFIINN